MPLTPPSLPRDVNSNNFGALVEIGYDFRAIGDFLMELTSRGSPNTLTGAKSATRREFEQLWGTS